MLESVPDDGSAPWRELSRGGKVIAVAEGMSIGAVSTRAGGRIGCVSTIDGVAGTAGGGCNTVVGGILGRFGTEFGVAVAAGMRVRRLGGAGLMAGAAVMTLGAARAANKLFSSSLKAW